MASGVQVDARLDEVAWRTAEPIPLPYEFFPGDNTPAPVDTRCFVIYDRDALHLGCNALDPDAESIRAYITDRDEIEGHDRIVFTLDPFNDARRAFRFGISALGVQSDAVVDGQGGTGQGSSEDPSWDAIWSSAGRVTERGFTVEATIPFQSLRFPSSDEPQTWGFYASRIWPRSERVETRSMAWDRGNSCELCQANLLEGFQGISPGTNLELTPTFTGDRSDRLDGARKLSQGPLLGEVGLDARWGITPNLTLNATLNPDFSQVEADAAQFDLNNRFALLFPEKRPFFLEGADFFSTPIRALFSRSIVDPSIGVKLTGKSGPYGMGFLLTRDEENNLLFPGTESSSSVRLTQEVVTAAARISRDLGGSSAVGGLYIGREGVGGYYNRVGGIDAFVRILPPLTARVQYLHSETRYAPSVAESQEQPESRFGGDAATVSLLYETREWVGGMNLGSRSRGFRADAGFVPQVDWRNAGGWVDRSFWAERESWFTRLMLSAGFWHQEDQMGRLSQEGVWTNVQYEGPLQTAVWLNPNLRRERFQGREYELSTLWFGGGIQPTGGLGFRLMANWGGAVDLANSREGRRVLVRPELTLQLGRRINVRIAQSIQDMDTRDGRDVFTARISELRAVYGFSHRASFRTVLQYRDTRRTPENWVDGGVDPSSGQLSTQLLFSYKMNPQSVLFLGYSDQREGGLELGEGSSDPLTLSGRTFFVKLGWAWRP